MTVELTQQQQQALDGSPAEPLRLIDPRTKTAYVLIPAGEYDTVREALEDDHTQRAVRAVGLRNALGRADGEP